MKQFSKEILVILIIFIFINSTQTYFHESIHADICNDFEGTSSIEYSFAMQNGKTLCSTDEGAIYHTINDLINHTINILILTIFMCLIFLIMFFEKREYKSEMRKKLAIVNLCKQ
ncbi:MAG: hypothetical protein K0B07_00020 [DPANN group archaeon]|nr:hypothetical protein [DPANN group archaeon]